MARDIEEFLRRAAERRQQQKGGGKPAPPAARQQPAPRTPLREEPVLIVSEIVEPVPVARPRQQPRPPVQQPRPRKKSSIRTESVSEHVASHIDTSAIAAHADHLGDRIASVHDEIEANVHKHLDHDITVIDDNPSVTDNLPSDIVGAKSDKFAQELRAMLANPKMVGKAVILAEILKRPGT